MKKAHEVFVLVGTVQVTKLYNASVRSNFNATLPHTLGQYWFKLCIFANHTMLKFVGGVDAGDISKNLKVPQFFSLFFSS